MYRLLIGLPYFLLALFAVPTLASPFQGTGFKIGEVDHDSAIVWTRLTKRGEQNPPDAGLFEVLKAPGTRGRRAPVVGVRFPDGKGPGDIEFAVPGAPGETRVRYRPAEAGDDAWVETEWAAVEPEWDYTRQHRLMGLNPGTRYAIWVESRDPSGLRAEALDGGFTTAPSADDPAKVVFTVSTGQMFKDRNSDDGFVIYDTMLKMPQLDFFVHTGDIVYYDLLAKTVDLAHWHWQRTYGLPSNLRFHREVGSYFIKDDHDTWTNDCWPTMDAPEMFEFTFEQGLDVFPKQVPMDGRNTYRTRRWGHDLQIWLVEGRDFRSANTDPDGPEKTIWGAAQKGWFKKTFAESEATFRILISPTPVVGPDRDSKHDNHSNVDFKHEGDEIRAFLAGQENAFVICGDRHWQFHSIHPVSGVHEFSCGPASDKHAGGWSQEDYREGYHQFLRVNGGFLSVTTERLAGKPNLTFRFHGEDGKVAYEKAFAGP